MLTPNQYTDGQFNEIRSRLQDIDAIRGTPEYWNDKALRSWELEARRILEHAGERQPEDPMPSTDYTSTGSPPASEQFALPAPDNSEGDNDEAE
jgi:hypothetical protein